MEGWAVSPHALLEPLGDSERRVSPLPRERAGGTLWCWAGRCPAGRSVRACGTGLEGQGPTLGLGGARMCSGPVVSVWPLSCGSEPHTQAALPSVTPHAMHLELAGVQHQGGGEAGPRTLCPGRCEAVGPLADLEKPPELCWGFLFLPFLCRVETPLAGHMGDGQRPRGTCLWSPGPPPSGRPSSPPAQGSRGGFSGASEKPPFLLRRLARGSGPSRMGRQRAGLSSRDGGL